MWRVKKKEQVTIIGPHSTPKLDKKKKKKIAQIPNRFEFYFTDNWQNWKTLLETKPIREEIDPKKLDKLWDELTPAKRAELLRKMKLSPDLVTSDFNDLPNNVKKTFMDTSKDDLIQVLSLIAAASLVGLYVNILDAPPDKPISQIRDEPIDPVSPQKPDREPSFDMSSSFVGKVTYSPDFQTMEINLNGKVYGFCNVPERMFDSFEGAGSKGAFFNREIKQQFDC